MTTPSIILHPTWGSNCFPIPVSLFLLLWGLDDQISRNSWQSFTKCDFFLMTDKVCLQESRCRCARLSQGKRRWRWLCRALDWKAMHMSSRRRLEMNAWDNSVVKWAENEDGFCAHSAVIIHWIPSINPLPCPEPCSPLLYFSSSVHLSVCCIEPIQPSCGHLLAVIPFNSFHFLFVIFYIWLEFIIADITSITYCLRSRPMSQRRRPWRRWRQCRMNGVLQTSSRQSRALHVYNPARGLQSPLSWWCDLIAARELCGHHGSFLVGTSSQPAPKFVSHFQLKTAVTVEVIADVPRFGKEE